MEPLEREIEQLQRRVPSVANELVAIRRGLGNGDRFELDNLRIASPCMQRWDDMAGDDRVRACAACARPVFNLSEMTRAEAEVVLATRGLTPCVRFYRRADGTVMTSDCPTRRTHRLAVVAASATLAVAPAALADAPQPEMGPTSQQRITIDEDYVKGIPIGRTFAQALAMASAEAIAVEPEPRPAIEWSLWGRLGAGIASQRSDVTARSTTTIEPTTSTTTILEAAAVADITFGIARDGDLRLGAFGELRTTSGPVAGGELVLEHLPADATHATSSLVVRLGANPTVITGELGVGYVGSWQHAGRARHIAGARVVLSIDRVIDTTHDWSATLGIEAEPIGLVHAIYDRITD
jgi:hypothetical protein